MRYEVRFRVEMNNQQVEGTFRVVGYCMTKDECDVLIRSDMHLHRDDLKLNYAVERYDFDWIGPINAETLEEYIYANYKDADRCDVVIEPNKALAHKDNPNFRYEVYPGCHEDCLYTDIATVAYSARWSAVFGITTCGDYDLWSD